MFQEPKQIASPQRKCCLHTLDLPPGSAPAQPLLDWITSDGMKMDVSSPEESSPEENMARRQGDINPVSILQTHPTAQRLFELSQLAATTEPLDDPPQLPGQDHESTIRRTLHPLARSRLSAASALHPR